MSQVSLAFVESLARSAGQEIRRIGSACNVKSKGSKDYVTAADMASAEIIIRTIRGYFPDDILICEDGPDAATEFTRSSRAWIVDPLDGTSNFRKNFPYYAVSICVCSLPDLTPLHSVVFDVPRSRLYACSGDGPAFVDDTVLHTSATSNLDDALILTGFSKGIDRDSPQFEKFCLLSAASAGTRRTGSAAIDICLVAESAADAYYHFDLQPWDTIAASHILRAAGGSVTTIGAAVFDPFKRSILATNGRLHRELEQVLFEPVASDAELLVV